MTATEPQESISLTNQILEKRIMIFLSASDETLGEDIFHHAGYVAPLATWNDVVVPEWQKRVLDGPPQIDEFHMTDLRSPAWRAKNGIDEDDVEARIDAAVDIVSKTKGLFAVRATVDGSHFETHASGLRFRLDDPRRAPADFVVDYPSFHAYVYLVLSVFSFYPKAAKVNFVIEKKREVFPAMHDFHQGLRKSFLDIGLPRFADLVGELIPGDKKRIPLQVADVLCWHTQRLYSSRVNPSTVFSAVDSRRFAKLTRVGTGQTWERQWIEELCGSLFEEWRKLNEVEGLSEVRPDNEHDSQCRSKSGESCNGSGEES
jgi:hypothetical protein